MDKPSTSGPPQKSSAGCRVRLIPATPRPEGTAPPTAEPVTIPNVGISQPPETSAGNLYSDIIREAMTKLRRYGITAEETSSSESSSEVATKSGTKTSPTSSSSLRFSTEEEGEAEENQGNKRTGRTFEEIASEVIREMREAEERKEEESKENHEAVEPLQFPAEAANREPQENPIREIHDLTETDDEGVVVSDG